MEVDTNQLNQAHLNDQHYLVMHNKTLKCVCELCTCGKHRCPRPRLKGNFSTSYTDHYKDIKIAPSNATRLEYKYQQRHYNPDALKTNYQQNYVPQQINNFVDSPSKLESYGSKILYQVPFVGQSSYKDQYKPYEIKQVHNPEDQNIFSPAPYRPAIKFDGTTSYKLHYVEPPKVQARPVPQPSYQRAQVPFYGASSYKNDFPQYKIQPKAQMQDMSMNYRAPTVKFQGTTSYTDQYKGYQLKNPDAELSQSRQMCIVQKLHVPPINYVNEKNHIYYDPEQKKICMIQSHIFGQISSHILFTYIYIIKQKILKQQSIIHIPNQMDTQLSKNICESLLKIGLIQQKTIQLKDRFELISQDLLNCFKPYIENKKNKIDSLKKIIGRVLSSKAKEMNFNEQKLKDIKSIIYSKINRLVKNRRNRVVKLENDTNDEQFKLQEKFQDCQSGGSSDMDCNDDHNDNVRKNDSNLNPIKKQEEQSDITQKKTRIRKRTKKYRTFDSDFKQKVCQMAIKKGIEYACVKYKFSKRKILGWLEAFNLNLLGKGRKALDPVMEFNMCVWIMKKIWNQIPLTQKVIREKASTMTTIGIPFNGSKGWLQKFFLRHVQLKSCFDTRSKPELKKQCIKYHQSAYYRLLKDYQNLIKLQIDVNKLVSGNLQQIIYGVQGHPILKLEQDRNLDKYRVDKNCFQDYQKVKNMHIGVTKEEEFINDEDDDDDQLKEEEGSGQQLLKVKKQQQNENYQLKYQQQQEQFVSMSSQEEQEQDIYNNDSNEMIKQQSEDEHSDSQNSQIKIGRSSRRLLHKNNRRTRMTLRSRNKMKKYFDDDDMGSDGEVEEGEEGVIRKINIFQEDQDQQQVQKQQKCQEDDNNGEQKELQQQKYPKKSPKKNNQKQQQQQQVKLQQSVI